MTTPAVTGTPVTSVLRNIIKLYGHSQFDRIIRRMNQILLRAKIPLRRLDRRMPEQQLDLLKLTAAGAA